METIFSDLKPRITCKSTSLDVYHLHQFVLYTLKPREFSMISLEETTIKSVKLQMGRVFLVLELARGGSVTNVGNCQGLIERKKSLYFYQNNMGTSGRSG